METTFFKQHHNCNAGNGFGHRKIPKNRNGFYRPSGSDIGVSDCFKMNRLATSCDQGNKTATFFSST